MRSASLLVVLAACGRVGFDDLAVDASIDTVLGSWSARTILSELHGDGSEEDPSVTQDRLEIVWSSDRTGDLGSYDVYTATRASVTAPFTNVRNVSELNTAGYDGSPEISPDGLTLYYSTDPGQTADIFISTRATRVSPWSPRVLRSDLSETSTENENELAISPDGLTAIVTRDFRFFELTRPTPVAMFGSATEHPELALSADCASPTIDNGARVVYYHCGTSRDIYVARRTTAGAFSTPMLVDELNTNDRDADPFISADERYMVFSCGDDLCEVSR